jgi:DNA topoisomerase-2
MAKAPTNSAKNIKIDYGLDTSQLTDFSVKEFFDDFLRLFSAHSNVRGIPFIGDGFKEAQRKAIHGMLDRGENAALISVERVSAHCAAVTDYHHGIGSMQGTIVGLAQDFAGSNNLNWFVPDGQFGSRSAHSASAPRYIMTTLHENFRKIFSKDDDILLDHKKVGDIKIEPKFFIPLLPTILANGALGMGTGHATNIFCYNPEDLRKNIQTVLSGKELTPGKLVPWWNGFKGKVIRETSGQVAIFGDLVIENSTTIRITELPVGTQSDPYEDHLYKLQDKGLIKKFNNMSDKDGFDFVVTVPRTTSMRSKDELIKLFKLEDRNSENFTCWGPDGKIKKYNSAEELLTDWIGWRLDLYEKRRQKHINALKEAIRFTDESIRFIEFYLTNVQKFRNVKKDEMIATLVAAGFTDYNRLLGLPIWSLTAERIDDLADKLAKEKAKFAALEGDNAAAMYERELKELKL